MMLTKIFGQKAANPAPEATAPPSADHDGVAPDALTPGVLTLAESAPKPPVFAAPLEMPENAKDEIFHAQPAHIQHVLTVLHRIARDAVLVGDILRLGLDVPPLDGPLAAPVGAYPIYCRDIEALFQTVAEDGGKAYFSFAYSTDLTAMDPRAQAHLSRFFGRIIVCNTLLNKRDPKLAKQIRTMLDQILLEALWFKGFFSGFAVSHALMNSPAPERRMVVQLEALVARTKADLAGAVGVLHDAGAAFASLPRVTLSLIVALVKPYDTEQSVLNGVCLDTKAIQVLSQDFISAPTQTA